MTANEELPQFTVHDPDQEWAQVNLAYDLAPTQFLHPVAIQVWSKNGDRTLTTGMIASTEDVLPAGSGDNNNPIESSIWFTHSATPLRIVWNQTAYVLAMIATPEEESP